MANRVTGKFSSVVAGANLNVACISLEVVQSVWNRNPCSKGSPIVVKDCNGFILGVNSSLTIELPNQFSFFVSILNIGLPAAS